MDDTRDDIDVSRRDDARSGQDPSDDGLAHMTREQWAERRASRSRDRHTPTARAWFDDRPSWQRWTMLVTAGTLAVVLLLAVLEVAASVGRIHPGVRVGGVAVGGMRPDPAAAHLGTELGPRLETTVTLTFEGRDWSVEPTAVAAALDTTSAVDTAMSVGRSGNAWTSLRERATAWFEPVEIEPPIVGEESLVAQAIGAVADEIDRDAVDASVVIEGLEARVEPSALGLAVRREEVAQAMLRAFGSTERTVEVATDFLPVAITDDEAERAADEARAMMSAPVTVVHEGEEWEFGPEQIATWIAFRAVSSEGSTTTVSAEETAADHGDGSGDGSSASTGTAQADAPGSQRMMLEAYIDPQAAGVTITPRVGSAGRPAQDARFSASKGTVTIIPSQDGIGPDIDALALEMTTVLKGDGTRRVELRTMRVSPEITTEDAQAMGITERFATYTTNYDGSNRPRVNNIHTLSEALDGTLLAPGETFSFNETIGPRTAAKGYQEAPAIVNGVLVPQLGGGICQVGTTIFNTVFESGLPVVERKNHSFYISSYPKGRDATVSWGGPDFKFKNDTEHWVLIATGFSNSSLTISLYGTDPGYEVTSQTGEWYDVTPHPVKEIEDPEMPVGTRYVEDSGVDGRKIVVTRVVRKGGSVVREDRFTSVYRPKQQVIRIGTKPVSMEATATVR